MPSSLPPCSICQGPTSLFYRIYDTYRQCSFSFFKCNDCEHLFIAPVLTEKELFIEYPYDVFAEKNFGSFARLKNRIFSTILDSWVYKNLFGSKRFLFRAVRLFKKNTQHLPKSYLDYGCGNAPNLTYFGEILPKSFRLGYEKSLHMKNETEHLVTNNYSIITRRKYDIISLFHVLEHVADLDDLFLTLKKITTNSSVILIQIPQANGINMKFVPFISNEFHFHCPYHLNLFSKKSLEIILKKYDFELVDFQYEIYQTHSILGGLSPAGKIILTLPVCVYAVVAKWMKVSNVITAYIRKSTETT